MNEARGYLAVLHNRNFLLLWLAQILALLSLNSTMFVTIILVEKLTGSSTQTAAVISAFSLPAVLLAAVAGIVVDRVSKKRILVVTNSMRLALQLLLPLLAALALSGSSIPLILSLVYLDIFVGSAIGQFFAPAEGAMIPLLVRRSDLYAANSLFTLTVIGTQVAAWIVLMPLAIKLLGYVDSLLLLVLCMVGALVLVMFLPPDAVPRKNLKVGSVFRRAVKELAEGWHFTITHQAVLFGILQLGLVAFLVFSVAGLLPGYASRVLGLAPEDAVFVFSPAGIGILISSLFVVRFADRFPRFALPVAGNILIAASFLGFGIISRLGNGAEPLFRIHPDWTISATTMVGVCAAIAGVALAMILIPAQTAVQEGAPDDIRGRVLTVQFTLYNALGIPPLLAMSGLADVYGIPGITIALGLLLLGVSALNFWYARHLARHGLGHPVVQPFPLPGSEITAVRPAGNGRESEREEERED